MPAGTLELPRYGVQVGLVVTDVEDYLPAPRLLNKIQERVEFRVEVGGLRSAGAVAEQLKVNRRGKGVLSRLDARQDYC